MGQFPLLLAGVIAHAHHAASTTCQFHRVLLSDLILKYILHRNQHLTFVSSNR